MKNLPILGLVALLAVPFLAFAQSTCTLNGQEVPCDSLPVKALFGLGIGLFIVMFAVGIVALVFWIKMLIHAVKNPIEHKPLWIIILLLFGIIGAIIYYFAVKKSFIAISTAPPTSNVNFPNSPV